jgi:hypothetical protein|uniref:Uncharacterized protein n=1 Tax=mine drainage metagenome TaxID=410659 RepID=E6QNG6_9ZZZZ
MQPLRLDLTESVTVLQAFLQHGLHDLILNCLKADNGNRQELTATRWNRLNLAFMLEWI